MKAVAHNFFSVGAELCFASAVPWPSPLPLVLGAWLGLSIGYVLDWVGHSTRQGRSVRTWFTHSLVTAPLWGASLGVATVFVTAGLLGVALRGQLVELACALGAIAAYSHLLLDALTEGGIFGLRHRIAVAHFGNGNAVLNSTFVLIGIALGLEGLHIL